MDPPPATPPVVPSDAQDDEAGEPLTEPGARAEAPAATLPPTDAEPVAGSTTRPGSSAGDEAGDPAAEDEEPPRRPVTKKRGRASVPSWDEIMFGGRDQ